MLKVVIIDDEPAARRNLETILTAYCEGVQIAAKAGSAVEGMAAIKQVLPDLIFLDIEMPHGSGFDLLEGFPERNFDVIFLTAYEKYAIKAIKEQAYDYLLKPTDIKEVQEVIRRYQLEEKVTEKPVDLKKLSLPVTNGIAIVKTEEIILIKGDGSYCHFFMEDGRKVTISKNLKVYADILEGPRFYRAHQSYLINLDKVEGYQRSGAIELKNGHTAELARSKRNDFLRLIE